MLEHRSTVSEGLGCICSWELRIFLSVTLSREDEKNIILQISQYRKNTESCSGLTCGNKGSLLRKSKYKFIFRIIRRNYLSLKAFYFSLYVFRISLRVKPLFTNYCSFRQLAAYFFRCFLLFSSRAALHCQQSPQFFFRRGDYLKQSLIIL